MISIVVIRHGVQTGNDRLSGHGVHQAEVLARMLARRALVPGVVLSSRKAHAVETSRLIAPNAPCFALDALTPEGDLTGSTSCSTNPMSCCTASRGTGSWGWWDMRDGAATC